MIVPQSPGYVTPSDRVDSPCHARRHQTLSAYFYGCRCPEALEASRLYRKRRTHGLQPPATMSALGASRRLRALMAIGWTQQALAGLLGESKQQVNQLVHLKHPTVTIGRNRRVAKVYEDLCGTAGGSMRARLWADRRGWLPPLAWEDIDDPAEVPVPPKDEGWPDLVAIERACRRGVGAVTLTDAERAEVKRRLLASPLPAREVAALLEVHVGTVDRWRASTRPSEAAA